METLSKEDIINNTYNFIADHKDDSDERQQAQMWIRDFLEIFFIPRQKINIGFEWRVNIDGSQKYADHLLNGVMLIEMKSRKQKLTAARTQAYRYVMNLSKEDIPRYILLSNFERIQLIDLVDEANNKDFLLTDLHKYIDSFGFLMEKKIDVKIPTNPVNEDAAHLVELLHRNLIDAKYPQDYSDLLMTRIVFCLFAEHTDIFNKSQFSNYLENETQENGSDLVDKLAALFEVLNTLESERYQSSTLKAFPYINGGLFAVPQKTGLSLNKEFRDNLISATNLDWSKISPVIFGSMFEGAMDAKRRHSLGAHYTSEKNILKIVNSLFLEELREEFEHIKTLRRGREQKLEEFHNKLAHLKFLDPACGSGNFLIVAYRELRRLEHEVIDEIFQAQLVSNIDEYIKVEVNQFYGIEILPYAASIAKLGLWLMDHLMNQEASDFFGKYYVRLPLHDGGKIFDCNALKVNWETIINPSELDYILGNPPFLGARNMEVNQKEDLLPLLEGFKKKGDIDFVGGWYIKAAEMMEINPKIKGALVSTNSISQGEQATNLWKPLMEKFGLNINFAHRTFQWDNKGAIVHVVIVGFSLEENPKKTLYFYDDIKGSPKKEIVSNINQYLLDTDTVFIEGRTKQISSMPEMIAGTAPIDDGNLIFSEDEKNKAIQDYPELEPYFHLFMGAKEHLQTGVAKRFLLYLKDAPSNLIRKIPLIREITQNIYNFRKESSRENTRKMAEYATLPGDDRYHKSKTLLIPRHSSSRREYVPFGFYDEDVIISDAATQLPNATLATFAILQSNMHMSWLKLVGGRIKSDFRYSNKIVYNTFVFPSLNKEKEATLENLISDILRIREVLIAAGDGLEDLYDPMFMPRELRNAHKKLDVFVDKLYRKKGFDSDEERVKHLINLYQKNR